MTRLILRSMDLDAFLTDKDTQYIARMDELYREALETSSLWEKAQGDQKDIHKEKLISQFAGIGEEMRTMLSGEKQIHVYSFETPQFIHGEVSRLVAKLRNRSTQDPEFVYYIQRAYELLFNLAFGGESHSKHHMIVRTPVDFPQSNYAVHKIPEIDSQTSDAVMCVMLRAALLPSMIVSKEIQEYSQTGHVTPFALFRISRDETKEERDMAYVLDLKKSYFDLDTLNGKDWFFADPMNATGGSLVTVVRFLLDQGIKPRSIKFFNVLSVMKGSLRIVRAIENAEIYTLWMDPALNSKAYILPGVGDAGDRINGKDSHEYPRNIIQLIADYGNRITSLYRSQVRAIEKTVLGI
ncbi:uracil phosphoribosyltransferase [Myxococcota bacterium]|nr:uracil phosphoribosyltransferase [Myxococcota bacterium]MBU1379412.1 uracil phosphoribosyltransferase [Myxococcota bacterium]MBU1495358.1 uracil phosphoribosyltransferase [Myxococcota bacterium]